VKLIQHAIWRGAASAQRAAMMMGSTLRLLAAATLASVVSPSHHASKLAYATCSENDPLQIFRTTFHASDKGHDNPGMIVDENTGRCLSVLDCKLDIPYPGAGTYGEIVLDVCGVDKCDGKSSQWFEQPGTSAEHMLFESAMSIEKKQCFGVNVVGKDDTGTQAHGDYQMTAWPFGAGISCPSTGSQNADFQFDPKSGLIKLGMVDAGRVQAECSDVSNCCVKALPCIAPECSLPSGWGWTLILIFFVSSLLYIGGGALYAIKVQGKDFQTDEAKWRVLLPHRSYWLAGVSLVTDGCAWSRMTVSKRINKGSHHGGWYAQHDAPSAFLLLPRMDRFGRRPTVAEQSVT
jgi:hypothetical protein